MFCLQIMNHLIDGHLLFEPQHADSLHLVEDWVMVPINFVPPVDIAEHEEVLEPRAQLLPLVCTGMGSE